MSSERPVPLAGVLRFLYLIAILTATLSLILTGVFILYEAPDEGTEFVSGFGEEEEAPQSDYARNVGLILTLVGTTAMATSILALGARANALRSGLLLAGIGVFAGGVGAASAGANNWLAILMSGLAFVVLAASFPMLENGMPVALGRGSTVEP